MRQRDVFGVLAGPLAWPAASNSSAAQAAPFRRLAVLFGLAGGDADGELRIGLVRDRMRQLGWEFGAKLEILAFYSGAEPDRIQANAKQAVALGPDVLLTTNTPSLVAAMNATRDIPIVFVNVSDPIASGAALSLARPGGNATGFTLFETTMGGMAEPIKGSAARLEVSGGPHEPGNNRSCTVSSLDRERSRRAWCRTHCVGDQRCSRDRGQAVPTA